MNTTKRYPILNIWADDVTMESALEKVVEFVEGDNRVHTIFAANPEKNFSVPGDPILYEKYRTADLLLPDGIGIVMAARLLYKIPAKRVPGCEFMQETCRLAAEKGYPVFIYGAEETVNAKAVQTLQERFPGIQIVGRSNGYVPAEGMDDLIDRINASGAAILFLALGSPRQEQWLARYGSRLEHVRSCQGIGGTLDVIAGNVKRAPVVFCKTGLEWFYRLISDPKRLKRQRVLPVFASQVLLEKMMIKIHR
ncbi:MAG: WecB/TagA/CpsF family glycosyltransferase [Thermodesulfobacteriota bacterium]|nr:WecB/TagA/CpsF family glycosyltransferase [Thermodesulfobacteriota bacterium]